MTEMINEIFDVIYEYTQVNRCYAIMNWWLVNLSPSAWAGQKSHQEGINWLITIISPCPKTLKITVLTLI